MLFQSTIDKTIRFLVNIYFTTAPLHLKFKIENVRLNYYSKIDRNTLRKIFNPTRRSLLLSDAPNVGLTGLKLPLDIKYLF